jgi:type II secretory pathway component PulM
MINHWWNGRDKREQRMLLALAVIIVGFLIYLFFSASPTTEDTVSWKQQRTQVTKIAELEQQIIALKQRGAHIKHATTPVSIQKSLEKSGLNQYLTATDLGSNSMALQLKSVPFDDLARWLTHLTQSTTAHLTHWKTTRLNNPGLVNSHIQLTM